MSGDQRKQLKFRYKISPSFSTYSVNGIHGGLNGFGEVVANFWHERKAVPKSQTCVVEDGQLKVIDQDVVDEIMRDVMFSVSMAPGVARAIGEWLLNQADQADKLFDNE